MLLLAVIAASLVLIKRQDNEAPESNVNEITEEDIAFNFEGELSELSRQYNNIYDLGNFVVGAKYSGEGFFGSYYIEEGSDAPLFGGGLAEVKNWDVKIIYRDLSLLCKEYKTEEVVSGKTTHLKVIFNSGEEDSECNKIEEVPVVSQYLTGGADQNLVFSFFEQAPNSVQLNPDDNFTPVTRKDTLLFVPNEQYKYLVSNLSVFDTTFANEQWTYTAIGDIALCRSIGSNEVTNIEPGLNVVIVNIAPKIEDGCDFLANETFTVSGNIQGNGSEDTIVMFVQKNAEVLRQ